MDRVQKAAPILALIRANESEGAVRAQGVESAYDVVWSGIKPADRPRKLSEMTVAKVLWWQDLIDARYMSEAAGAYQVMEDTLRTLKVDPGALFDRATQDALAVQLLDRRGWARCEAGQISPEDFADQLAREWASFPVVRDQKGAKRQIRVGQSYYAGDGLNKSHTTPATVLAAIREALAGRGGDVPSAPAPLPAQPPQEGDEAAVVSWLQAAPGGARGVGGWLVRMPAGIGGEA